MLEIIRSADSDRAIFHARQVIRWLGVDLKRRGSPHRLDMRIERPPLLQAIQLPDAQTDAHCTTDQHEQRGKEPLAGEHRTEDQESASSCLSGRTKTL